MQQIKEQAEAVGLNLTIMTDGDYVLGKDGTAVFQSPEIRTTKIFLRAYSLGIQQGLEKAETNFQQISDWAESRMMDFTTYGEELDPLRNAKNNGECIAFCEVVDKIRSLKGGKEA